MRWSSQIPHHRWGHSDFQLGLGFHERRNKSNQQPIFGAGNRQSRGASANMQAVGESTSADVNDRLFGEMIAAIQVQHSEPVGTYTGPDGSHPVYGQEWLDNAPAGAYTYTFDNTAYANAGGLQPFVAVADLAAP